MVCSILKKKHKKNFCFIKLASSLINWKEAIVLHSVKCDNHITQQKCYTPAAHFEFSTTDRSTEFIKRGLEKEWTSMLSNRTGRLMELLSVLLFQ